MELVMFLSMTLFTGFCTTILVLAIFSVYGKKQGEAPACAASTQTNNDTDKTA